LSLNSHPSFFKSLDKVTYKDQICPMKQSGGIMDKGT